MALSFTHARFIKGAHNLSQCPPDMGMEVAVAGRSNAGKSSALNVITGVNRLARTSKQPGRTQQAHRLTTIHASRPITKLGHDVFSLLCRAARYYSLPIGRFSRFEALGP